MNRRSLRSMLYLQMGQEVLYLLMTIGIMSSLVLLLYTRFVQVENSDSRTLQLEMSKELKSLKDEVKKLKAARNDQPPIITLSEAQGYYFPSGSAFLSKAFRELISRQIVAQILEVSGEYDAQVVEVVGHTDEVPVSSTRSTIDRHMLGFISQRAPEPVASDNVGLGMIRAAAVVRVLRQDPRLDKLIILPLSAGQTTTSNHQLSTGLSPLENQQRRRIEIRVRRHFGSKRG